MQEFQQRKKDKYVHMEKIKKILNNDYTLSVAVQLFTAVIGIVSSAFCTRFLGVRYKGDYNYITQISNIVVLILNMGIYQSYSYNYKKYGPSILKKYIDICFFQFFILLIVSGILIITTNDILISLIAISVPFSIIRLQFGNIVLIEKIRLSFLLTVLTSVIQTICYIVLFYCVTPGIIYVVGITIIMNIISVIAFVICLRVIPQIWNIDFTFFKSVLRFGIIPMLSAFLSTINYRIDIIFLKHIGLPDELSYYSLATGLISYVWMIPDAFKSVLYSKSGKKFDRENILFSSQVSSVFIIVCLAGFAVLGKFLLGLLYGDEFVPSYGVTMLLIVGAFSMSFFKITGVVLISQGRRIAHFVSLAISATVNVILNFLLIPSIGMYGAAIASVCSYTICGLILLIYFCKLYNMNAIWFIIPSKETLKTIKQVFTSMNGKHKAEEKELNNGHEES